MVKNDQVGWLHGFRTKSAAKTVCVQECDLKGAFFPPRGSRGGSVGGGGVGWGAADISTRTRYGWGERDSQISVFSLWEGAKSSRLTQMTSSLVLSGPPLMPDRAACFLSCVMRHA